MQNYVYNLHIFALRIINSAHFGKLIWTAMTLGPKWDHVFIPCQSLWIKTPLFFMSFAQYSTDFQTFFCLGYYYNRPCSMNIIDGCSLVLAYLMIGKIYDIYVTASYLDTLWVKYFKSVVCFFSAIVFPSLLFCQVSEATYEIQIWKIAQSFISGNFVYLYRPILICFRVLIINTRSPSTIRTIFILAVVILLTVT